MTWGDLKKLVETKMVMKGCSKEAIDEAEVDYIDMSGDDLFGPFDVYINHKPSGKIVISIH